MLMPSGIATCPSDGDGTEKELSVNTGIALTTIYAKVVMNTTNNGQYKDVHIPGYKKHCENKSLYHLRNTRCHSTKSYRTSESTTKSISWKSLGFNYEAIRRL